MKYKGLLLDYDGTTVPKIDAEGGIVTVDLSSSVEQAVRNVAGRVHIGFCTGRKFWDLQPFVKRMNMTGPHVCCTGAQLIDSAGKPLWEQLLSSKMAQWIFEEFRKKGKVVHVKSGDYHYVAPEFLSKMRQLYKDHFLIESVERLPSWEVPELVAIDITHEEARVLEQRGVLVWMHRRPWANTWFADITAPGATKQEGVLQWLRHTGLHRDEVVAVGDGMNDYSMLMAVGLKIAMGNAVAELKEIADFVCPSVDEDGLVTVIEKFFDDK